MDRPTDAAALLTQVEALLRVAPLLWQTAYDAKDFACGDASKAVLHYRVELVPERF